VKIGIGCDVHRLSKDRAMILGGVAISHTKGSIAHSDGDVLLHAICDAILGALGRGDIGLMFPDTDPALKSVSSSKLLKDIRGIMDNDGFAVSNLDCTVIAEEIRIATYRDQIVKSISDILQIEENRVNVKGKTAEGLGETGKGNAIEAHAVVLLTELN